MELFKKVKRWLVYMYYGRFANEDKRSYDKYKHLSNTELNHAIYRYEYLQHRYEMQLHGVIRRLGRRRY